MPTFGTQRYVPISFELIALQQAKDRIWGRGSLYLMALTLSQWVPHLVVHQKELESILNIQIPEP